ncbi:MAG TPA: ATPase, T2SS/T4P/T4SS family [Planctomycetota bacterium]|nr:ATPase, T2SS/T4P/T4SS family [Planctomycetota bacterium]
MTKPTGVNGGRGAPRASDTQPLEEKGHAAGQLLTMRQAIELLKTSRPTFYRWVRQGRIVGTKLGRQWRFRRADVERFLAGQEPRIELRADLSPLIENLRRRVEALGAKDVAPPDATDIVHAVSLMIRLGVAMQASDIHIEPSRRAGREGTVGVLRYRVDGVLHPVAEIDARLLPALDEQWKTMANCDVHEKVRPQDGRIEVRLADTGQVVDLRVCFVPAVLGPSLTVRVLDASAVRLELDRLGYAPRDKERLLRALRAPWGTLLITGPTGCGKTTVLYACLNHLVSPERKLMAVEDPVEFLLPGVVQVAVRPQAGVTFATAVRSFLRSAPNVIMVGEVRDLASLQLVHQAALTGHLVLTTLHADEAARALVRMVEIGSDPFLVADSTKLIIAQRLIRKLCPECSVEAQPLASHLEQAATLARAGGLDWAALPKAFRAPRGCAKCHQTGFRGREVIAEALEVTPEIGAALRRGASLDELRTIAIGQGMTTMAADGIRRAAEGATSLEEVLRVL